jgi:hypothetical protein
MIVAASAHHCRELKKFNDAALPRHTTLTVIASAIARYKGSKTL